MVTLGNCISILYAAEPALLSWTHGVNVCFCIADSPLQFAPDELIPQLSNLHQQLMDQLDMTAQEATAHILKDGELRNTLEDVDDYISQLKEKYE